MVTAPTAEFISAAAAFSGISSIISSRRTGIIKNFANALLGLEEFFVDGLEGINGVELMNAIELSGWKKGATVTLPVNEEEYLEELNKRRASGRKKAVSVSAKDSFGNIRK